MQEETSPQTDPTISRRRFIGAIGAAAIGGALLQRGPEEAEAQSPPQYLYQDSYGNIVPASAQAIAAGIYPPAIWAPGGVNQSPGTPAARRHGGRGFAKQAADRQAGQKKQRHKAQDTTSCQSIGTCPSPPPQATYYNAAGFPYWNILLIIVDQMRPPSLWPPQSGPVTGPNGPIPNISQLMNWSCVFQNYFVAADRCSPSRATLLTGLYPQQHCIFVSQEPQPSNVAPAPSLLPYNNGVGFPSIGDVLSQMLPIGYQGTQMGQYDTTWIGKWHVSCLTGNGNDGTPGAHGPSDYGFTNSYCIPNTLSTSLYPYQAVPYPSPNGAQNEGNGGDYLDSFNPSALLNHANVRDVPGTAPSGSTPGTPWTFPNGTGYFATNYVQLNDSAIAQAFNYWLAHGARNSSTAPQRWFCAVSFENPHDIDNFPWSFGLTGAPGTGCSGDFCAPTAGEQLHGYPPPPTGSATYTGIYCNTYCPPGPDQSTLPGLNSGLYPPLTPPSNWNNGDDPIAQPYGYTTSWGKPGLQAFFENQLNQGTGKITDQNGWLTFLNYYFWMQSCVDQQIGQVLFGTGGVGGLKNSPFWNNTLIIFTADHGEFGGSHDLHDKGGAVYDEVMNVPFFLSFPSQRLNNQTTPINIPFVCSSVDFLPLVYCMALGNDTWRSNPNDIIYYLNSREGILDAVFNQPTQQRRLSNFPLANPFQYAIGFNPNGTVNYQNECYQPFVLHTTDEIAYAPSPTSGLQQPSHAIALRTVDFTVNYDPNQLYPLDYPPPYGGGKLGLYSFWDLCNPQGMMTPPMPPTPPIFPDPNPPGVTGAQNIAQYEFYNYNPQTSSQTLSANPGETGNQAFTGSSYSGGPPNEMTEARPYWNYFFNKNIPVPASCPGVNAPSISIAPVNVQYELYNGGFNLLAPGSTGGQTLPAQIVSAIAQAYLNYVCYIEGQASLGKIPAVPCNTGETPPICS